jgi:hypothetical protein
MIADELGADVEELVDKVERTGLLGLVRAGMDAARRKAAEIEAPAHDPAGYDLVVVGTPVWAWTMSCAVRAYLKAVRDRLPAAAFFCTARAIGIEGALARMQEACGRKPLATLGLRRKDVLKGDASGEVAGFARRLRGA